MKNIILTISALLLTINHAQAKPTTSTETEHAESLAAQVAVTSDAAKYVLSQIKQQQESSPNAGRDFHKKASEFNRAVEAELVRFEQTLQSEILKPANFYISKIREIRNSTVYTKAQKNSIIADQVALLNVAMTDLSNKYSTALNRLYAIGLPDVAFTYRSLGSGYYSNGASKMDYELVITKSVDDWFNEQAFSRVQMPGEGTYGRLNNFYGFFIEQLKPKIFSKTISNGCQSASCVVLFSNLRNSFINLIHASIDHPIAFGLAGYDFYITNNSLFINSLKKYLTPDVTDLSGLPLVISPRQEQIQDLSNLLLNPKGGFFSSYECPASVAKIKEELCRSELRCINSEETNAIVQAIKDADIYSKSARIECLNER